VQASDEHEAIMISEHDLTRLMERPASDLPVLSLFLDLRDGTDHRRSHDVFLAQRRTRLDELVSAWPGLRREALEDALDEAAGWLTREMDPASRGAAVFTQVGGGWLQAFGLPVPLENGLVLYARPALAPLRHALQGRRRAAVALVDREHLRLLCVWLGRAVDEEEVRTDPYPAAHDVQGGGFAQQRYQRRKLEEEKHFFTGFAAAMAAFVRRTGARDVALAGTEENVARFRRFLPPELDAKVTATVAAPVDAPVPEILERLGPLLDAAGDREAEALVALLRERAGTGYRSATGLQPTLAALQAGRVETLLLGDAAALRGGRCTRCGFLFAQPPDACPYDGARVEGGVHVVEEALRMAHAQGAHARLLSGGQAREFAGAGALLRF
jgi:hypothetical protein